MDTFDLKYLLKVVKKNLTTILLTATIGIVSAAFVSFLLFSDVYSASTQVIVTQANDNSDTVHSSEVQANIQMVNTYSIILKSKDLLKSVAVEYPQYTAKDLYKKVNVASDSNSQVINVTFTDPNPNTAVAIVNELTEQFIKKSKTLITTNNVSVLSRAYIEDSKSPSGPNHKIHLVIGLFIGLFVAAIIIIFKELFDTTFKSEETMQEILQLPVIGIINEITEERKEKI